MENENAVAVILQCLEKSLAVSAYKCIMHVGREFLCKMIFKMHFSPLLIIEDMVKGLRRRLKNGCCFLHTRSVNHILSLFPLPDVQCVRHQLW